MRTVVRVDVQVLSVSSNGSTWVKPLWSQRDPRWADPFSILERIDVGETECRGK